MPSPAPDEFLNRLRAIYCRHKGLSYEAYDQLFAEERISYRELQELCSVLWTEIQNAGLYDFLFREEAEERERKRKRLKEIEAALARIGSMARAMPAMSGVYAAKARELAEEGNRLRREVEA